LLDLDLHGIPLTARGGPAILGDALEERGVERRLVVVRRGRPGTEQLPADDQRDDEDQTTDQRHQPVEVEQNVHRRGSGKGGFIHPTLACAGARGKSAAPLTSSVISVRRPPSRGTPRWSKTASCRRSGGRGPSSSCRLRPGPRIPSPASR